MEEKKKKNESIEEIKKKILLEIINNRLYQQNVIDERTRDKILSKIWE